MSAHWKREAKDRLLATAETTADRESDCLCVYNDDDDDGGGNDDDCALVDLAVARLGHAAGQAASGNLCRH